MAMSRPIGPIARWLQITKSGRQVIAVDMDFATKLSFVFEERPRELYSVGASSIEIMRMRCSPEIWPSARSKVRV